MVHKKINYAIMVFVLLCIAACTKISKQDTTIEFVIRNPVNGEPFENIPVRIKEERSTHKGIVSETIFEGKTDANGRASYTFRAKEGSGYWYYPYIDDSYFGGTYSINWRYTARPIVSAYAMKKDQYNEALYEIVYYAFLKLKIKNVNCEGATDTLKYHAWMPLFPGGGLGYDYTSYSEGCYDFETTGNGISNEIIDGHHRQLMGWHHIEWECRRPSGITYGKDSIYLDAGEFGTMELLY